MNIKKGKKNIKFTTIAWIMAVMLLVIIIPLNIVFNAFDLKLDLTENKLYSLTDVTKDYLSGLDKKVDFYFLMDMDDLKSDHELMALANILEEYSQFDCINFHAVDPETHPEIKRDINPDGYLNLKVGDMIIMCGDNKKHIKRKNMYSVMYDENGYVSGEYFNGENYITGAIKSVVEGIMPPIYFLTGHGEKTIENNFTTFRKNLANNNYRAKSLNLSAEPAVPEDAAIIIVAAPQTDITSDELAKIEDFMDKGGNLSLLMSPNDNDKDYKNLEEIMRQYCIGMDYDIVSETDSSKCVANDSNTIMVNLVDPENLDDENITDLTSVLIDQINTYSYIPYMPASRTFYEREEVNISDLTICPLIETYESAVAAPYGGEAINPNDMGGVLYLGAYSEDRIRDHSKLVVMGSADFIDDKNLSDDYFMIPVNLYLSTISWMYNSDVDMNIASKTDKNDYMTLQNKEDTNTMIIILYAAPVIVAIFGIIIWLKRRHA